MGKASHDRNMPKYINILVWVPQNHNLKQRFKCNVVCEEQFIWEVIRETLVGELGSETGKGRQSQNDTLVKPVPIWLINCTLVLLEISESYAESSVELEPKRKQVKKLQ